jgi:hypothetical protein
VELTASVIRAMMEAMISSETSDSLNLITRRNIPEGSHLHMYSQLQTFNWYEFYPWNVFIGFSE